MNDIVIKSDAAEFGKALIAEAEEREKKRKMDVAIVAVSRLMQTLDALNETLTTTQKHITLFQKRIDAIRDGRFTLKVKQFSDANQQYDLIRYDEDDLNGPPFM